MVSHTLSKQARKAQTKSPRHAGLPNPRAQNAPSGLKVFCGGRLEKSFLEVFKFSFLFFEFFC